MNAAKPMREAFIQGVYDNMRENDKIFFLSADFGAPALDKVKNNFPDRFINVGIAEQNLINIATGIALEGFTVYAYAIAPFLIMRAYEQIRNNLSLLSVLRELNINLIGVGAGLSYDVSGPTHHGLEDISAIRTLPNICVFSPCDNFLAAKLVQYSITNKKPKYFRLDGKPLSDVYNESHDVNSDVGFFELVEGGDGCLISTGYMTHTALQVADRLMAENIKIGIIDVFTIKPLNESLLNKAIKKYKFVITLEEAFINKNGLDRTVINALDESSSLIIRCKGFEDSYGFDVGSREYLHRLRRLDADSIIIDIKEIMKKI